MPRKKGLLNRRDISQYQSFIIMRECDKTIAKRTLCTKCTLCERKERVVTPEDLGYDKSDEIDQVLCYDGTCEIIGERRIEDMTRIMGFSGYKAIQCSRGDDKVRVTCENCAHAEIKILEHVEDRTSYMRYVYICKDGPYAERCNNRLALSAYVTCDKAEEVVYVYNTSNKMRTDSGGARIERRR